MHWTIAERSSVVVTDLITVVGLASVIRLDRTPSNADVHQLGPQAQDEAQNERDDNNQDNDADGASFWGVNLEYQ